MGEKDIASVRDHAFDLGHHPCHGILETLYADFAAFLDMLPVELVVLPALQRHIDQ